jgi:hypothetical protein
MNTVIHALTTLWVYLRREHYLDMLLLEDDKLAMAEKQASGMDLALLHARRASLAQDMYALSAPLRWNSLFSAPSNTSAMRSQPAVLTTENSAVPEMIEAA